MKAAFEKAYPGEDFGGVRVLPATDPKYSLERLLEKELKLSGTPTLILHNNILY